MELVLRTEYPSFGHAPFRQSDPVAQCELCFGNRIQRIILIKAEQEIHPVPFLLFIIGFLITAAHFGPFDAFSLHGQDFETVSAENNVGRKVLYREEGVFA